MKTYKYILKLQHVENGEYSIIHLLSPTCTSLDNLKKVRKKYNYYFLNLPECIYKYVINQHHCDKIKYYSHVDHYYYF